MPVPEKLDNSEPLQDKLFELTPLPPEPEPPVERLGLDLDYFTPGKRVSVPQPTFRDKIPAPVQKQLEERQAEFERRYDQLDHAGMPEGKKQETLRREFPDLMSAEEKEISEVEAIKKAVKPTSRPKKDRRHLGWRGKLTADKDKVSEATYGRFSGKEQGAQQAKRVVTRNILERQEREDE